MTKELQDIYIDILKEELVPAMGCTEPIAVAFCAATAREVLEKIPDRVSAKICGNIIKNVKSAVVPNTGGLKGLEAAVAVGLLGGDAKKQLEVIEDVTEETIQKIKPYIERTPIEIEALESEYKLDMDITVYREQEYVRVRICNYHTNIVRIEKNGEILFESNLAKTLGEEELQKKEKQLSVRDILEFAHTVEIEKVREFLDRQINYNYGIAKEGMEHSYGGNIGKVYLDMIPDSVMSKAVAYAAAGSDARMNGCEKPVIILSGSGNQGITASVPVVVYAQEMNKSKEELYRALLVSDLITIHQKTEIGRLSAFCGAVSAGCGSACGIAYLLGADEVMINHTIVNTLAISSGIICDGAKASCAGKIALAVQTGILGYYMYKNGQEFKAGDGIVAKGVEPTILNVGRLGSRGMVETDKEILAMMTGTCM